MGKLHPLKDTGVAGATKARSRNANPLETNEQENSLVRHTICFPIPTGFARVPAPHPTIEVAVFGRLFLLAELVTEELPNTIRIAFVLRHIRFNIPRPWGCSSVST